MIEDDADVRALAVKMLKGLGYGVIDVPNAVEARDALRVRGKVDLILSDVVLPGGTSGPEFVEEALALYPGLKAIFMSGYAADSAKRNGFLGSNEMLLNKPFQKGQLAKVLREALVPTGSARPGKGETILVVEDEDDVRQLAVGILGSLGYQPLEARDGKSALAELDRVPDIAVLFSDVILPGGMLGTELAREALRRRPELKVLFTSGYTENAIVHHSRLDDGVELIEKPYRKESLARRLNAILGGEDSRSMTAKRLLVVDDEPGFRELVRNVAVELGFAVEETSDAAAFKRVHDAFAPTVVVVDIVMPDVDGTELVRWLAERRSTARVVVVTGYDPKYAELPAKLGDALGLRSSLSLTKPVTLADLRAALEGGG